MNSVQPKQSTAGSSQIGDPSTGILGWTIIALSAATALGFIILSAVFNFPEVLRNPAKDVLPLYAADASTIRPTYWLLMVASLALICVSPELGRILSRHAPGPARLVSGSGVATGVFWALGYSRWSIAMPFVSKLWQSGETTRAGDMYEVLNKYAGMTVGEHLGFLMMGVFAIALAVALRTSGIGPKWFFPVGVFSGILIAATAYEQYNNIEWIGMVNGVANTIWFIWFAAIGWVLIRRSGNLAKVVR
jgi:Domain of unknown function (DUF4386)